MENNQYIPASVNQELFDEFIKGNQIINAFTNLDSKEIANVWYLPEIRKRFRDFTNAEQNWIAECHRYAFKRAGIIKTNGKIYRVLVLGNPWCAINQEHTYCRIDGEESCELMKVLFSEYL